MTEGTSCGCRKTKEGIALYSQCCFTGISPGERKVCTMDVGIDSYAVVIPGIEVRLSMQMVESKAQELTERYGSEAGLLQEWLLKIKNVMDHLEIRTIDEYYTGDTSLISLWALVCSVVGETRQAAPEGHLSTARESALVNLELRQIQAPTVAARIDRQNNKLAIILKDSRFPAVLEHMSLIDYTVNWWTVPARMDSNTE